MYIRLKSLEEICEKKLNGRFISGGTDLLPLMKLGLKKPELLIDVTKVPELCGISISDREISIGASVSLSMTAANPDIARLIPALAQSAEKTASLQIRNVASIGGNIMQDRRCIFFNQSSSWRSSMSQCFKAGGAVCLQNRNSDVCRAVYYSDTATALILYEAEAEVIRGGFRYREPLYQTIAIHSCQNGLYKEDSDCLLTRIYIPIPPEGEKSGFMKYSVRSSIDFPIVNFAIRLSDGARPSLAVAGAVAPVPLVLKVSSELPGVGETCNSSVWGQRAADEIKSCAGLVRESVIPPKVKLMSYNLIGKLLADLTDNGCL